jgi:hypothetical protein
MDKAELEKLEWMTDVTEKRDDSPVRFGLDGSLIPRDADLPISLGLHHHGDDAQAAGYSLEELFSMVRSSVTQQKVLALQTLSKIITKAWCGVFVELMKGNLLQNLVDAGFPVLLRLSLDEPIEAVHLAAIQCLHALLVEAHMEVCGNSNGLGSKFRSGQTRYTLINGLSHPVVAMIRILSRSLHCSVT